MFNARNWYWVDASGRTYGSARGGIVAAPQTDADMVAWRERGLLPTSWPKDDDGLQTDEALQSVLSEYGLYVSRKDALIAAVNAKRDAVIAAGYTHNFGGTAGIRTLDQRDARDETAWLVLERQASKAAAAVEAGLIDPADARISIRDARNEQFAVSPATAVSAMDGMASWRYAVSKHSWDLKDEIEAADDQAALFDIDIDTGWPG